MVQRLILRCLQLFFPPIISARWLCSIMTLSMAIACWTFFILCWCALCSTSVLRQGKPIVFKALRPPGKALDFAFREQHSQTCNQPVICFRITGQDDYFFHVESPGRHKFSCFPDGMESIISLFRIILHPLRLLLPRALKTWIHCKQGDNGPTITFHYKPYPLLANGKQSQSSRHTPNYCRPFGSISSTNIICDP